MPCAPWRPTRSSPPQPCVSLALGIGANTAIYSFMDAILLRALPVPHPEQLAVADWHGPRRPPVVKGINGTMHRYGKDGSLSPNFPFAAYELLRCGQASLFHPVRLHLRAEFQRDHWRAGRIVPGGFVSGNYFSGLGVPPAAGRLLDDADDRAGAPPAGRALLRLLAAALQRQTRPWWGKSILVNNLPFTVVGVAAPGFFGVDPQTNPAFFLPIHAMPCSGSRSRSRRALALFRRAFLLDRDDGPAASRRRHRAGPGRHARALSRLCRRHRRLAQRRRGAAASLSLEEGGSGLDSLRRQYSKPLYVLMTMVGLILAIACANLANLLLARAAARRREIAVRLSLGASRGRVVRQMLTESVLLSVTGGVLGLGVALAGIRFITWLMANGREHFTLRAALDWPVLGFTFALALVAGMLFGLAPAIQATKVDFTPALKENRLQGSGAHGLRFRPRLGQALIVLQIAVSLLLVIGAGLFVRTLANLHAIDVGFNRENLLLVRINGRQAGYRDAALARFYAGLLDRFREIPGVRAASASSFPLVAQLRQQFLGDRPRPDAAAGRLRHRNSECRPRLSRNHADSRAAGPRPETRRSGIAQRGRGQSEIRVHFLRRRKPRRPPVLARQAG